MLKLPKDSFTYFEDACIDLNILNVRFRLILTLLSGEDGPCDYNVVDRLLHELLDDYQRNCAEFRSVFNSLDSVKVIGATDS